MEIKRKFQLSIATTRRFIIRQAASRGKTICAECGEPMLTTEQTANFFGIKQRRIFQIIEINSVHFTEIESGSIVICLSSLAAFLDGETNKIQLPSSTNIGNAD